MQALFTSFYLNGHTLAFAFILCEPPHLSFLAMSPLGYTVFPRINAALE